MLPPAPLNGHRVVIDDDDLLALVAERAELDVSGMLLLSSWDEVGETVFYLGPRLTQWQSGDGVRFEYRDRRHTVVLVRPAGCDVRGWTDADGIHVAEFNADGLAIESSHQFLAMGE